jgi:hypothetical protein
MNFSDQFRLIERDFLLNRWRITDDQVNAWRRLDQICPSALATDCVINVGAFLNILDRQTATVISRELNVLQIGVHVASALGNQITEQILRSERIRTFHEVRYFDFDIELFRELFRAIEPGHATMLELRYSPLPERPNIGGHLVVLAVLANGEPVLLDPQNQMYHVGDGVREYINNGGFTQFGLYLRHRRFKRPSNETELQIRKKKHDSPANKRRRIYVSPESSPQRDISRAPSPVSDVFDDDLFADDVPEKSQTKKKTTKKKATGRRKTVRLVPVAPSPEDGEIAEEPTYPEGSPAYQPPVEAQVEPQPTGSPVYNPVEPEPEVETAPRRGTRRRVKITMPKGGKHRRSHKK